MIIYKTKAHTFEEFSVQKLLSHLVLVYSNEEFEHPLILTTKVNM